MSSAKTYSDLPIVVQAYLNTALSQWTQVLGNVTTIETQMSGVQTKVLSAGAGSLAKLDQAALQNLAKAA